MTASRVPAVLTMAVALVPGAMAAFFGLAAVRGRHHPGAVAMVVLCLVTGFVAVLLMFLGIGALRRATVARRALRDGVPGQAHIVAVARTGSQVNSSPEFRIELEVTAPAHGTYRTAVREYVPLLRVARLTSGLPVRVLVDPADRDGVVIDWAATGGPAGAAAPDPAERAEARERILRTGSPARATLLSVTALGQVDDRGLPVYDVMLHVQVPGRPATAGPARIAVPLERVAEMRVGGVIPVRVDPDGAGLVAADWDRQPS